MTLRYLCLVLSCLAFLLGTLLAQHLPARPVVASPADVRGSDNVLVTGYRNRAGTFLLWSSGRITRPDGSLANAAGSYVVAPGFCKPVPVKNQTVGAAQVACGVTAGTGGTVVLFSDGTGRRPVDGEAAAPWMETRVIWGYVDSGPTIRSGSGDWSVIKNAGPNYHVSFHPEFQETPSVVTGGRRAAYYLKDISPQGFDLCNRAEDFTQDSTPFTFVATGR